MRDMSDEGSASPTYCGGLVGTSVGLLLVEAIVLRG